MTIDDLNQYIRQGEPTAAESASAWKTAIGLQAVDGLRTSDYLLETARRNIEGEITIDEVRQLLTSYYNAIDKRNEPDEDTEEADKVAANIKKTQLSQVGYLLKLNRITLIISEFNNAHKLDIAHK